MTEPGGLLPETRSLDEAMLYVQTHRPEIVKDRSAEIETRTGKGFGYSFADLVQISDKILPLLAALGVLWQTEPDVEVGPAGDQFRPVLRWRLKHVPSEQERTGMYPLRGESPQARGSEITFARRYCLVAVTGLTPQDDDDALAAEAERAAAAAGGRTAQRQQQRQQRQSAPTGGTAQRAQRPAAGGRPPVPSETRPISPAQRGTIVAAFDRYGITDRAERLEVCSALVARQLGSANDMTGREASTVIQAIEVADASPDPAGAIWQAANAALAAAEEQRNATQGGNGDGSQS